MKIRNIIAVGSLILVSAAVPGSSVRAANIGAKRFVRGEAIVTLQPGTTIAQINAQYGTTVIAQTGDTFLLSTPDGSATNGTVKKLRNDPAVAAAGRNDFVASPNARRPPSRHPTMTFPFDKASNLTSDRSLYDSQPMLSTLRIDEVTQTRGEGVIVAIIDTGVDLSHPDLAGKFIPDGSGGVLGLDLIDGGPPMDDPAAGPDADNSARGHGTFIAGLVAKVAPAAKILPIRALDPGGVGTTYNVVLAVEFARANGAHVINMSFGAPDKLDGLDKALSDARDSAVLVAAVGNFGSDGLKQYPADESFVVAVAALDDRNVKAPFSNFGSLVDVAAPGVEIASTFPGNQYATWSGTSFATPLVAATAALVVSKQLAAGGLDVDCATRTVIETSTPVDSVNGNGNYRGKIGGRVDPVTASTSSACDASAYDKIDLRPVDPNDRRSDGEAERETQADLGQEFEVKVERLTSGTTYALRVTNASGGTFSDSFTTDSEGNAKVEYKSGSDDDSRPLPAELTPVSVVLVVEVLRTNGSPVLRGDFSTAPGGGDDDGDDDGGGGDDDGGGGDDDGGGGDDDGGGGDDDGGGGGDDGGGGGSQGSEITLFSSGIDDDAEGTATWSIDLGVQKFRLDCEELEDEAEYELWVNGILVATMSSDDDGGLRIRFSSAPESEEIALPASMTPVSSVSTVAVRKDGQTILSGSF